MPKLTVTVSPKGHKRRFHTAEELQNWASSEAAVFDGLARFHNNSNPPFMREAGSYAAQSLKQLNELASLAGTESRREEALKRISEIYTSRQFVESTTPEGKHVVGRLDADDYGAAGAFLAFTDRGGAPDYLLARAVGEALLLRYGYGSAKNDRDDLEAIYATGQQAYAEALAVFEDRSTERLTALDERVVQLDETRKASEVNLDVHASDVQAAIQKTHEELDAIKAFYEDQVALQEPVTYWKSKANGHRNMAIGFTVAVVAVGGMFVWLFLREVSELLRPAAGADGVANTAASIPQVVTLLTLATLGLWAIRLLVRVMLSHIHLTTDAQERAVLIQTYLAMKSRGHVSDNERLLVLQTVFRPSTDGMVKEDSAPPSVPEVLSRMLAK